MAKRKLNHDEGSDLGFGTRVAEESRERLLNRDGSFNVVRKRQPFMQSLSPYHSMLTMSWPALFAVLAAGYLAFNLIFAEAYVLCGDGALRGSEAVGGVARFVESFFFSIHTSAPIGYGHLTPQTIAANVLVMVETVLGLLGIATSAGLVFARLSRPDAKIVFSRKAVIAPYRGITAFEFRIANQRNTQLIQVAVDVVLTRMEAVGTKKVRKFHALPLERRDVMFFPLHWTIVHPIDDRSPLAGVTEKEFFEADPEILILITGIDETFSQTVHARSSYKAHEIIWGARFKDMFDQSTNGRVSVDLQRIHETEAIPR